MSVDDDPGSPEEKAAIVAAARATEIHILIAFALAGAGAGGVFGGKRGALVGLALGGLIPAIVAAAVTKGAAPT